LGPFSFLLDKSRQRPEVHRGREGKLQRVEIREGDEPGETMDPGKQTEGFRGEGGEGWWVLMRARSEFTSYTSCI